MSNDGGLVFVLSEDEESPRDVMTTSASVEVAADLHNNEARSRFQSVGISPGYPHTLNK